MENIGEAFISVLTEMTSSKNNKHCDMNCPFRTAGSTLGYCCKGCAKARKQHLESLDGNLKSLWFEGYGFADENGCRLPRQCRPPECLEYDCKESVFITGCFWNKQAGKWEALNIVEVDSSHKTKIECDNFKLTK